MRDERELEVVLTRRKPVTLLYRLRIDVKRKLKRLIGGGRSTTANVDQVESPTDAGRYVELVAVDVRPLKWPSNQQVGVLRLRLSIEAPATSEDDLNTVRRVLIVPATYARSREEVADATLISWVAL